MSREYSSLLGLTRNKFSFPTVLLWCRCDSSQVSELACEWWLMAADGRLRQCSRYTFSMSHDTLRSVPAWYWWYMISTTWRMFLKSRKTNHLPQAPQVTNRVNKPSLIKYYICICVCVCVTESVSLYILVAYWPFHIEGQCVYVMSQQLIPFYCDDYLYH